MLQRSAFHQFPSDKRPAVLLANLVDRANVGVIQCGCRTRLSPKTFQNLRVLGQMVGKKLERDKPAKRGVLRLVHNPHTAATQLCDDSVARDRLADHGANHTEEPSATGSFRSTSGASIVRVPCPSASISCLRCILSFRSSPQAPS